MSPTLGVPRQEAQELLAGAAPADDDNDSLVADAAAGSRHSLWRHRLITVATVATALACLYLSVRHLQRRAFELRLAKYNELVQLSTPISAEELEKFEEWKREYDEEQVYWLYLPSTGPSSFRLAFFTQNLRFIEKENKAQSQVVFDLNGFSDEDPEEFVHGKTGLDINLEDKHTSSHIIPQASGIAAHAHGSSLAEHDSLLGYYTNNDSRGFPSSVDWVKKGAVTSVKTQGDCGSCYAMSTAAALEGAWFIFGAKLMELSDQQIIDCSQPDGNDGCNGGLLGFSYEYLSGAGACTYKSYPFEDKVTKCRQNTCQVAVPSTAIQGWWKVKRKDEISLLGAVLSQPVSVGICASGIAFQNYKAGVISRKYCGQQPNHAGVVVGYGTESGVPYYLMKNSWGTIWGEKGYAKIQRGPGVNNDPTGVCAILSMPSFPQIMNGSDIPTIVPEGPPDEEASCLPGDSLVQVQGRGQVPIGSLQDEDRVLVHVAGSLAYERVLGFLHALRGPAALVAVTHEHGELRASANHLIFIRSASSRTGFSRMVGELRPGDVLSVALDADAHGEKGSLRGSQVLAVRHTTSNAGLFAPLTAAGTLIVDDVVASTYAVPSTALRLPHAVAHGLLFSLRAYHALGLQRALASCWARFCRVGEGGSTISWLCQGAGLSASSDVDMHPFAYFALAALRLDKLLHAV